MGPDAGDPRRAGKGLGPASEAGLGRRIPFSSPLLWYPTLAVLALDEIVEVPIVAAMVVGRLLVSQRPPYPVAQRGSGDEA